MSTLSSFAALRLDPPRRRELLRGIVERARVRTPEGPPVVVFDLDGTLMDNRPRVAAILRELSDHWRKDHPSVSEALAGVQAADIVYDLLANLRRLGVTDPSLHEQGLFFWRERFFHDPHIKHDVEVPGAREFVRACYEAGAVVVYLTGRDLPNMVLGTVASLRDLGFPIGVVGTELVVKPAFEIPDTEYKRGVMPDLRRLGRVIAAFDNESANTNLFLEEYPECASVFLDTQHAPNPPPLDPRVSVIESFKVGE
jgi:hypothetical protein